MWQHGLLLLLLLLPWLAVTHVNILHCRLCSITPHSSCNLTAEGPRRMITKAKLWTQMWVLRQLTAVTGMCSFTPPCCIYMCLAASRDTMLNPNGIRPLVHLHPVLLGPRAVCSGLWRRHNLHSLLLAPCTRHTCLAAPSPSTQDVHYVMQHPTLEVSSEMNNYMHVERSYCTKVHGTDACG